MKFKDFVWLLCRNWLLLLSVPLATGVSIYFFSKNQGEEYTSDTIIYTGVTSGFGIKNDNSHDFYASSKAFSNLLTIINSRDTKQEVALRLLASHLMLDKPDAAILSAETYARLQELISQPLRRKLVGNTLEETVDKLSDYQHASQHNPIRQLLDSEEEGYSYKALSRLTAHQIGGSDLMKVEYVSKDAAMCRHTLEILSEVFIQTHKDLLEGQNQSVIQYFQSETAKAAQRLETAEQRLLDFHKANNIINYEEQAIHIANEKQNLLQRHNALEIEYAGTLSALKAVERNMDEVSASVAYSQEMIGYRNQLAALNSRIAELEGLNSDKADKATSQKISWIKRKAAETEEKIKASTEKYYRKAGSVQGIANKDILNEWVKNVILVEELKGQLAVTRKQNEAFTNEYAKVAPLGADLRKIEREIEMAEKEYFSQLNGLSQSKITQQNIELTSQLKVVDPAFTPTKPNKSKQLLLLLLGTVGAFFMVTVGITAAALLHPKIRNSGDANTQTGLPVLASLPLLGSRKKKHKEMAQRAEEQLARQLLVKMQQYGPGKPAFVVGVLSSLANEGKSTVISTLASQLQALGLKTLTLLPDAPTQQATGSDTTFYPPLEGLTRALSLGIIARKPIGDYDVLFIEFPALLEATYPVSLFRHLDFALVTLKANRAWLQTEKNVLASIRQLTSCPMELVLNGVLYSQLDPITTIRVTPQATDPEAETVNETHVWQGQTVLQAQ